VIIGLVGDTSGIDMGTIELNEYVERVMKVQEPYKRTNRKFHPDNTIINICTESREKVSIGGGKLCIVAGPCSVETEEQIAGIAVNVKNAGAAMLRGGAFKPRTSPYSFQGLKAEGLMYLKKAREVTGLPVVSEITNMSYLDMFVEYVDVIQVGTRNMQNYELLKELGKLKKPILLKRGFANTIEELLLSSEYIMSGGNENIVLCERGIRTFETMTRNTLDLSAVPILKRHSHLPVMVDPSHASGIAWLVEPLAMASIAAGADGLLIEVHNDPANAVSDGNQSLTPDAFSALMKKLRPLSEIMGRTL
jgi:3-deoxy-7-phosphoheptulonate synthase